MTDIKGIPLAVITVIEEVILLEKSNKKSSNELFLSWSKNGIDFIRDKKKVGIKRINKRHFHHTHLVKKQENATLSFYLK